MAHNFSQTNIKKTGRHSLVLNPMFMTALLRGFGVTFRKNTAQPCGPTSCEVWWLTFHNMALGGGASPGMAVR